MNAQEVAEALRKEGVPVLEVLERGPEGEIKISNRYCVQVGPNGSHYCVTYECDEHTLAFAPLRYKIEDVVADAKIALKNYP